MRTVPLLLMLIVLSAASVEAQGVRAVGVHAGQVRSRWRHDRSPDSEERTGPVVGAFVDVQSPAGFVSILAEASWTRRGGAYPIGVRDTYTGTVQVDYLTLAVLPVLRLSAGPLSVLTYAGPAVDIHVRTRAGGELAAAFATPSPQVLTVDAGAGVELALGRGWSVRGEFRVNEGLTHAFSSDADNPRSRSREILVRVGRSAVR
ncbi:MAG TPA: hypothetical protein VJ997_13780 [Longimicrobiales bacterium]|nr:hypothetical protein [Longimicrobiales bacterium]